MSRFSYLFSPGIVIALLLFAGVFGYGLWVGEDEGPEAVVLEEGNLTALPLYNTAALWGAIESAASSTEEENEEPVEVAPEEETEEAPTTITSFVKKAVQKIVGCPSAYAPVCGKNGVTYKNSCVATEAGAWIVSAGECAESDAAPAAPSDEEDAPPAAVEETATEEPVTESATTPTEEEEETPLEGNNPDFTTRAVSHFGGILFEGNQLSFSGIVKNQGSERAFEPSFAGLYLDIGNDEKFELSFTPQEVHALEKGEELQLIWKNAWIQTPGTHTIALCADSTKVITESLEKNNCETKEFTVGGKAENADLRVTGVSVGTNPMKAGARAVFSATVENSGPRIARSPWFRLWVDTTILSSVQISPSEENGYDRDLEPGETDTITWSGIWIAKVKEGGGNYTFKVCADSKEEIAEANEEDNCKEGTFTVTP